LPRKIKTVLGKVAPANLVPAAAVIRGGQVLFGQIGRKAFLGGFLWVFHESTESDPVVLKKTEFLEFWRGKYYFFSKVKIYRQKKECQGWKQLTI
jgi:hypothetical protein